MCFTSPDLSLGYIISDRSDNVVRMVLDSKFTRGSNLSSQHAQIEHLHDSFKRNFSLYFFFSHAKHILLEVYKLLPMSVIPEEQVLV